MKNLYTCIASAALLAVAACASLSRGDDDQAPQPDASQPTQSVDASAPTPHDATVPPDACQPPCDACCGSGSGGCCGIPL